MQLKKWARLYHLSLPSLSAAEGSVPAKHMDGGRLPVTAVRFRHGLGSQSFGLRTVTLAGLLIGLRLPWHGG